MSYEVLVNKMEGLGNTQALVKADNNIECLGYDKVARAVCSSVYGVGADQMILWGTENCGNADVGMRVFNGPDGEEVEMCGNGARCLALLAHDKFLRKGRKTVKIATVKGERLARFNNKGSISIDMGVGTYDGLKELDLGTREVCGYVVDVGNPHFVVFEDDKITRQGLRFLAQSLGKDIETHHDFPEGTNVEFFARRRSDLVDVEVWERGAGYTLACGTGACATVLAGYLAELLEGDVDVQFPIGSLRIEIEKGLKIVMVGTADYCGDFFVPDIARAVQRTERLRSVLE